jgi:hypothetical protein
MYPEINVSEKQRLFYQDACSSKKLVTQKKGAFQLTVTSFIVQAPISSIQQVCPVQFPFSVGATGSLKSIEFGPPEITPGGTIGRSGFSECAQNR